MRKLRPRTALLAVLYAAMALVVAVSLLKPVSDPDFFWHLKTGEWIRQHRQLPASDPFNYTSPAVADAGQRFTLAASWLSEVLYSAVHDLLGMPGIVALKFLVALLLVLLLQALRRGDPVVHAALVLATLPLIFRMYTLDRPQALSFVFFAALLVLLEGERTRGALPATRVSYLPVPLLMLVWANAHGGYVVGQITIALFVALEGAKFLHPWLGPASPDRYRRLAIVGGAGLLASFVNPNTHHAFRVALSAPPAWIRNTEYLSTVAFYRETHQPLLFIFWGALALTALAGLLGVRRPDITRAALLGGIGYFAFSHVRYVPFFMIAAVPAIGAFLSAGWLVRWARPALAAGSVVLVALLLKEYPLSRGQVGLALRVNENLYPVRAADFVLANAPRGNLYNTYFWGGYLLWRLAPERKVFIDGRGFSSDAAFQSFTINMAFARPDESPPLWKKHLQQHGVGYLIIPRLKGFQGITFDEAAGLRAALLNSPEWVPVFADAISLVFVLNVPEHLDLIRRHAIPRERLLGWSHKG